MIKLIAMKNDFLEYSQRVFIIQYQNMLKYNKKNHRKGVPVRDYKKIQNILMGTPASASNKEGSDFSESSLF